MTNESPTLTAAAVKSALDSHVQYMGAMGEPLSVCLERLTNELNWRLTSPAAGTSPALPTERPTPDTIPITLKRRDPCPMCQQPIASQQENDLLRVTLGIRQTDKIPLDQLPTFGSILVDVASTRCRVSPTTDEAVELQAELNHLNAEISQWRATGKWRDNEWFERNERELAALRKCVADVSDRDNLIVSNDALRSELSTANARVKEAEKHAWNNMVCTHHNDLERAKTVGNCPVCLQARAEAAEANASKWEANGFQLGKDLTEALTAKNAAESHLAVCREALDRIATGRGICCQYDCDPSPTEKEVAAAALAAIGKIDQAEAHR